MSYIYNDIERSFSEYVNANLVKGTGEVLTFEFPTSELGSSTYSVEFISHLPRQINGRAINGGSSGRYIDTLAQIDVWRLSYQDEPDIAGALRMLSRVTNLFKATHYIPLKTYGSAPTATTTGTVNGAIRIDEMETSKQAFDPNPNLRRYTQALKLTTKEVF